MKKKNMFVRGVIVFIILLGSCSRNMKKEGLVFQNENGDSFRLLFKGDSVFIFNQQGNNDEYAYDRGTIDDKGNICLMTPYDWVNGWERVVVNGVELTVQEADPNDGKSKKTVFNFNQDKSTENLNQYLKKFGKSNESSDSQSSETSEDQASSSNVNLSEIRGMIIQGGPKTVENLLGIPKERIIGPDYAGKVLNYKLGMKHEMAMLDYYVWVYSSTDAEENNRNNRKSLSQISEELNNQERYDLSGDELIVAFDKNDKVCKVAFARDIKEPYDLTE